MRAIRTFFILALLMAFSSRLQAESSRAQWLAALGSVQEKLAGMDAEQRVNASRTLWPKTAHDYPVYTDWLLQDAFEEGFWEQVNTYGQPNAQNTAGASGTVSCRTIGFLGQRFLAEHAGQGGIESVEGIAANACRTYGMDGAFGYTTRP